MNIAIGTQLVFAPSVIANTSKTAPRITEKNTNNALVDQQDALSAFTSPSSQPFLVKSGKKISSLSSSSQANAEELTEEEEKIVRELKKTDAKVRAHEQAHKSAAGPFAGPITFETVTGPDGREYAVAGKVEIDISPENTPEATIRKMDIVIRAALAPAQPSPEDFSVARQAQQIRLQARKELQDKRDAQRENKGENANSVDARSGSLLKNNKKQETENIQGQDKFLSLAIDNIITDLKPAKSSNVFQLIQSLREADLQADTAISQDNQLIDIKV